MAKFLAKYEEEQDEDGGLSFSGAHWTEPRLAMQILTFLFALFGLIAIACGLFMRTTGRDPGGWAMLASVFASCFAFMQAWIIDEDYSRKFRSVYFHANGDILTPNGLPRFFWRRRIDGHHANIASIEAYRAQDGYSVVMYSTGGDTIVVSQSLARHEAHKASVMLTNALQAMRASLAQARIPAARNEQAID